ncbi:MAG: hypothetical protein ACP5R5_13800 [Armatimonadota bacterium]
MLTLAVSGGVWGCVGARPLAMGGAFVGVADDVHATYWNPAGLAFLAPGGAQTTFMHTVTNRDAINYQEYVALASRITPPAAARLGTRRTRRTSGFALGVSYILSRRYFEDTTNNQLVEDNEHWLWMSAAIGVSNRLAFGANARVVVDDTREDYPISTDPGFDLAVLYLVTDRLSAGLLIQDVNRPTKQYRGVSFAPYARNWRPGIAYRPTDTSLVAVDAYDLADEGGCRSFRVGGEILLGEVTVRAGYYGLGGSGVPRAATFGVGTHSQDTSIDLALLSGDLDNTLILSASRRLD